MDSQDGGLDSSEVVWLVLGFFCVPLCEIQSWEDASL